MAEEEVKEKKAKKKSDNAKIGAVIVLVISALVFIPTGGSAVIQSIMQKRNTPVFGKYKGEKIEYKAGSDMALNVANKAQVFQSYGYDVSQIYSYIFESAFEETVQNMYYNEAIKTSGYSVPKSAVNRMILPFFRDETGAFSKKLFNQTDESKKSELRAAALQDLTISRFTDDVFGNNGLYGLKVSSKESAFVASMGTEKHAFQLAAFSTNTLPKEEAVKYAKNNMDTFRRYNLSAITLSEKIDADNTLKQIQNGEITFADAVSTISEKLLTDSEGKITDAYYYQLKNQISSDEDLATVVALSKDALSPVVQTTRGYTIFRCDGAFTAIDLEDDAAVDAVTTYIKSNEMSYIENYYTGIANKFIYDTSTLAPVIMDISDGTEGRVLNPASYADKRLIDAGGENIVEFNSFELACKNYGTNAVNVSEFPVNYGNSAFLDKIPSDVSELSSLATNSNAMKTMFALKENEISEPFVLGSNVIVVKCTSIQKDDVAEKDDYAAEASSSDRESSTNAIMASPDLENNFFETFLKSFMN